MRIRRGHVRDIPQLIRMRYDFSMEDKPAQPELFDAFYEECEAFFQEMFASSRWSVWVAEADESIVSHIYLERVDTIPRPGRKKSPYGYITNVYTKPEYRARGIGGAILQEINRWAKENGFTFLTVWPSEASVKFYERHGFARAEEMMENHL